MRDARDSKMVEVIRVGEGGEEFEVSREARLVFLSRLRLEWVFAIDGIEEVVPLVVVGSMVIFDIRREREWFSREVRGRRFEKVSESQQLYVLPLAVDW